MGNVVIKPCYVYSVKADLVKGEVKITLSAKLTGELQEAVRMKLGWWSVSEVPIDVIMTEWQEELPNMQPEVPNDTPV